MYYGQTDMINKTFIMQQSDVSKATKMMNLSDEIFAGTDLMFHSGGMIHHSEFFKLAKSRDIGFHASVMFFSKISSETDEQILTRQMFRFFVSSFLFLQATLRIVFYSVPVAHLAS